MTAAIVPILRDDAQPTHAPDIVPFVRPTDEGAAPKTSNKKQGVKSEVYAFKPGDAHKIVGYFVENNMWVHYLMFIAQLSVARRNSDMRLLKWKHFFNPANGKFREHMLEINEKKTGKFANPAITQQLRDAIRLYVEKTGCDPSLDQYERPVFLQLSGTHRGRVLSYDGCRKAIKRAAEAVGVEYNVGTHSARKSFGATVLAEHPKDPRALELLSGFFNHSNTRVTEAYTGRTKQDVDQMCAEVGDRIQRFIIDGEAMPLASAGPVVSIDSADLRQILMMAYQAGRENANETDPSVHMDAFDALMGMVEDALK